MVCDAAATVCSAHCSMHSSVTAACTAMINTMHTFEHAAQISEQTFRAFYGAARTQHTARSLNEHLLTAQHVHRMHLLT